MRCRSATLKNGSNRCGRRSRAANRRSPSEGRPNRRRKNCSSCRASRPPCPRRVQNRRARVRNRDTHFAGSEKRRGENPSGAAFLPPEGRDARLFPRRLLACRLLKASGGRRNVRRALSLTYLLLSPRVRFGNVDRSAGSQSMESVGKDASSKSCAMTFVQSEVFARTFREGMSLVEETANYLDGEGREASKSLSRSAALSYAGASMRLTTQLMQIASWLLVLRAVREGDMAVNEAAESKYRLSSRESASADLLSGELPNKLLVLIFLP